VERIDPNALVLCANSPGGLRSTRSTFHCGFWQGEALSGCVAAESELRERGDGG